MDFASNDYLALAGAPRMRDAVADALARGVPVGSGGSRLLRGNHAEHEALECEAAAAFGAQAALYFPSGYAANAALFATLPQHGDLIVHDALIHASAHEGMRLGRAQAVSAAHNDAQDSTMRSRHGGARAAPGRRGSGSRACTGMDGDQAPLAALAEVAARHDAMLVVDEAHATGVFGRDGCGLARALVERERLVTLHTCGKALGAEGALLCLPAVLRDILVNRARAFIFSTAPSPLMASAVRAALRCMVDEPERRAALWRLVETAGVALARCGVAATGSPIIPVIVGDDAAAMRVAAAVQAAGYDVRGIRPPTVPAGTARGARVDHAQRDRRRYRRTGTRAGGCLAMTTIVVTGTDTEIGKSVFSAALAGALRATYWKPIQAGTEEGGDAARVATLAGGRVRGALPEAYRLATPCAPQRAAAIEGIVLDPARLALPAVEGALVVEGAGGVLVPITDEIAFADLFAIWRAPVVLVARTALGTINHTLLSIEALRARGVDVLGVAFVGEAEEDAEGAIVRIGRVRRLGRLPRVDPLTPDALAAAFARGFDVSDFA